MDGIGIISTLMLMVVGAFGLVLQYLAQFNVLLSVGCVGIIIIAIYSLLKDSKRVCSA